MFTSFTCENDRIITDSRSHIIIRFKISSYKIIGSNNMRLPLSECPGYANNVLDGEIILKYGRFWGHRIRICLGKFFNNPATTAESTIQSLYSYQLPLSE